MYHTQIWRPGPEVIKLFSCSIQMSTEFILLINVKMPTIGILTFISMMNTTSERFKARNFFICRYLSPCFLKKASGILQSPLSVRPSRYLLLNHWTKSNQIWCVSCSHEWGVQRHFFSPLPGEGPKGQISLNIIKFQLLGRFQRFLNQTLCVLSQMKDIKHIRQDFYLAAWVMSQGWDLGVQWGVGGSKKFFFRNSTRFGV